MSEQTSKTVAVVVKGRMLWRCTEGREVLWAERNEGETAPSAWALWSARAKDVGHCDRAAAYGL